MLTTLSRTNLGLIGNLRGAGAIGPMVVALLMLSVVSGLCAGAAAAPDTVDAVVQYAEPDVPSKAELLSDEPAREQKPSTRLETGGVRDVSGPFPTPAPLIPNRMVDGTPNTMMIGPSTER